MTIEQAQIDFDELIAKNGFTLAGHTSDTGTPLYHRVWKKTEQVAWHGEQEETQPQTSNECHLRNRKIRRLRVVRG